MTSPIVALKQALAQRLAADPALLALLRAPKIHAEPPRHPTYPCLAFTSAEARENGTATDDGHLTDLTLAVLTRGAGDAEGPEIAEVVRRALAAPPWPALAGHRLVNLVVRSVEPTPSREGEARRTLIRLRAATEVV